MGLLGGRMSHKFILELVWCHFPHNCQFAIVFKVVFIFNTEYI